MAEIDRRRAEAHEALEAYRLHRCPSHAQVLEFRRALVEEALREWWANDCKPGAPWGWLR